MSENKGVWVFSEKHDSYLEILGKARELADILQTELAAVLIGSNMQEKASELIRYGACLLYTSPSPRD